MVSNNNFLRSTAKKVRQFLHDSGLPIVIDTLAFRMSRAAEFSPVSHVLIAPPGEGNIGDQAMIESFLENTTGTVRIVSNNLKSVTIPADYIESTDVVMMPHLIYGSGLEHLREVARLRSVLRSTKTVSVIGADIMDGAYNSVASQRRAFILQSARRLNLDTRVLGFSWNGTSTKPALRELRKAGKMGAHLMLRDSTSAKRATADGLDSVSLVADLVFSASAVDESETMRILGAETLTKKLALVNVSGLVGRKMDQVSQYVQIIELLVGSGRHVVLLPHVSRPGGDDIVSCRSVWQATQGLGVQLLDELLEPAAVRSLVQKADVIVTGRMHLAIIALSQGTPALTLSTQGKVEGLMKQMGIPEWCLEPRADFGDSAVAILSKYLTDPASSRSAIASNLSEIQRLSRLNFSGLDIR